MKRLIVCVVLVCGFIPLESFAVPNYLSHQGRVFQSDNTPLGGVESVTFSIYTAESGGSNIWTETISVTFDDGYYSVILGENTSLEQELFDNDNLFLGIAIGDMDEFSQRFQLLSVPFAIRAGAVKGQVWAEGGLIVNGVEVVDSDGVVSTQTPTANSHAANKGYVDGSVDAAVGELTNVIACPEGSTISRETIDGVPIMVCRYPVSGSGSSEEDTLSLLNCQNGEVAKWTGSAWECAADDVAEELQVVAVLDCSPETAGTLSFVDGTLKVCGENGWVNIVHTSSIGIEENPGDSCSAIYDAGDSNGNGAYWIKPPGDSAPFEVYCDMSNNYDGYGWTLIAYAGTNNDSLYSLKEGGGTYSTSARTGRASLPAVNLAKNSTIIAFSAASGNNRFGSMSAYDKVHAFILPAPGEVTFDWDNRGNCTNVSYMTYKGPELYNGQTPHNGVGMQTFHRALIGTNSSYGGYGISGWVDGCTSHDPDDIMFRTEEYSSASNCIWCTATSSGNYQMPGSVAIWLK